MTLLDRQKEFTGLLVKGFSKLGLAGLPLKSACAVTGNATQENLVKAVTTGRKDHGSDGTLQWRLDRLDGPHGLKGWSAAQGMNWATLEAQAAFFLWELHRDYPALESDLRAGKKSIETLTANICRQYERPSNKEYTEVDQNGETRLDKRIRHAKSIYKIMSAEKNVKATTTTGAGAAVVIGSATIANAAQGGSLTMTAIGAAITGLAAIAGPIFAHFSKRAVPERATAPTVPSEAPASVSDLPAALAEMRACKAAFDAAVMVVRERISVLHDALEAAEVEAAQASAQVAARITGGVRATEPTTSEGQPS